MRRNNTPLHIVLTAVTLLVGIVLGLWQLRPPAAPVEGEAGYAAYQRMLENLERFAVKPRPNGSAELGRVREMILAEIEGMGLEAVVDGEGTGIHNIFVRLPGKEDTSRGVMFVSHYDSTQYGPGAADAMLPVCAMLETMRLYSQGQNGGNIYYLITDAEEDGLLGARQFVRANPWLKDRIHIIANFEARGNRGGLILFETSPNAYRQMRAVFNTGVKTIGFSWAAAVYAMMPNQTDFTEFLNEGYQGVNYAAIEGVETYHTPEDNFDNLDKDTAWHYLQTAFALTGYAANLPADGIDEAPAEAVYFPFFPGNMVLMASATSQTLCISACVLALLYGLVQMFNRRLKFSFSTVLMALLILLSAATAFLFPAGSYLFYIPLFAMTAVKMLNPWTPACITARALSGAAVLLLWVPLVFLLWVSMIQPMML